LKKLDLAETLQLFGNAGVILGILLLVYELNQNRDMMQAQIRNEIATSLSGALPAATDAQLAEVLFRSDNAGELTGAEAYQASLANELIFRYWENAYYQYRQGLYDDIEFLAHREEIARSVNRRPRLIRFWCLDRDYYSQPFVDFIDSVLTPGACQVE
jgi:hypothetical protein